MLVPSYPYRQPLIALLSWVPRSLHSQSLAWLLQDVIFSYLESAL